VYSYFELGPSGKVNKAGHDADGIAKRTAVEILIFDDS
jgi:hypothetical protein